MKQLVVLSGKGGTGKTSLTAAFAHLSATNSRSIRTVLVDADVDAANLELVLNPRIVQREDFWGGQIAEIDQSTCSGCGICEDVCRFDAVSVNGSNDGRYIIDSIACDGCATCVFQCPCESITMRDQVVGQWFRSECRYGPLFHAALRPAQENSGKLVTLVKQHGRLLAMDEEYELVLVDGPPGTGCPVISAASGADLALIVVEPTVSGEHDMQRALQVADHFGIRALVSVNKADISPVLTKKIEQFCQQKGIEILGRIPFDEMVIRAMARGKPVTEYHPESSASQALRAVWAKLVDVLNEGGK
ncbi:MAG: P-loop NTPase [Anaerolineales bacterium]|jgi:MinD superfamily P-loop ATPase